MIPDTDPAVVALAQSGNRDALEQLIAGHQRWIYNIVLRMVYLPQDAEDITQEILIKLLTKLSTFEGRSSFRTWLYRIAVNHVLNMKRSRLEEFEWSFQTYGDGLNAAPDEDLADPNAVPADVQLLVEEAKIGCTSGMLLCLSREQRLIYILGEILGTSDAVGAELFDITRDNFRQKLARARHDLHQFMGGQCGLVNDANPCRCANKTKAFIRAGYVDPDNLVFAKMHLEKVREVAPRALRTLEALDEEYAEIHRGHPFHRGPDFMTSLRKLLSGISLALVAVVVSGLVATGCVTINVEDGSSEAIVALEKGALDKWSKGDPSGFYDIMAANESYFDPLVDKRVDGLEAFKTHMVPFAGKFTIDRYEMVNPQVLRSGNLAVLNFNLVNYGAQMNGGRKGESRWNSTEVYSRVDGKWKIVHSHWSYTKPDLKPQL